MGYWDYRTRLAFIQAARETCQHERACTRIYQALADRAVEGSIHDLLLQLAEVAESQAEHDATRLRRLGVKPVPDGQTWWEQLWRNLLVRSRPSSALAWIERTREHDVHQMVKLVLLAQDGRTHLLE